ncbi:uncharacterized protein ACOB7L_028422 isoform 6-T10 [Callospermophilus lateralis]|uniref:uncharacterized protein LOC143381360 isoform X6 n=1 Tax=Callospermophilus lateralis TaxID=76772 RepID=UPI004038BD6E
MSHWPKEESVLIIYDTLSDDLIIDRACQFGHSGNSVHPRYYSFYHADCLYLTLMLGFQTQLMSLNEGYCILGLGLGA